MKLENLFAKTKPRKLFFAAAIPGAISMVASSLYMIIDGIFIGQFLGELAFAAVTLAMPFVILNFALADLIGVGSSVPIAVSLGEKQEEKANNVFTCACIMIVLSCSLIGVLLYITAPFIMNLMGADGEFASLAVKYLRVYAILSPVMTMMFAVDNYLRICGKIKLSMTLNILASFLAIILEVLFLLVFRLGIVGAALASSVGMSLCAIAGITPFIFKKLQLKFTKPKFSFKMIKEIISCGAPNFLNTIAGRISSIVLNIVLLKFGGTIAVTIYGILMSIEGITHSFYYGMCDSLQPAISYNWGCKNLKRIVAIEKYCFSASAIISFVFAIITFVFPQQIVNTFINSSDPTFLSIATTALRLFSLTYLTRWFSFATQSYFLAIEKPIPASIISVSTALVFPLLLVGILWNVGLTGLWLNVPITALLSAILAGILLIIYKKIYRQDNTSIILQN